MNNMFLNITILFPPNLIIQLLKTLLAVYPCFHLSCAVKQLFISAAMQTVMRYLYPFFD